MSESWFGNALEGAAKGAAAGSVVPGIGTAIGAAGGLALQLAPELGRWLFGPGAGETVKQVQAAVASVTGTADPAAQLAAASDPQVAGDLRIQLAQIAADRAAAASADQLDAFKAALGDVANARAQTETLAAAGSGIAWGAPLVSVIVLLTFGGVMLLAILRPIPEGSGTVVNVLLGTLGGMAASVVAYWVGSNAGSRRKTELVAQLASKA